MTRGYTLRRYIIVCQQPLAYRLSIKKFNFPFCKRLDRFYSHMNKSRIMNEYFHLRVLMLIMHVFYKHNAYKVYPGSDRGIFQAYAKPGFLEFILLSPRIRRLQGYSKITFSTKKRLRQFVENYFVEMAMTHKTCTPQFTYSVTSVGLLTLILANS